MSAMRRPCHDTASYLRSLQISTKYKNSDHPVREISTICVDKSGNELYRYQCFFIRSSKFHFTQEADKIGLVIKFGYPSLK